MARPQPTVLAVDDDRSVLELYTYVFGQAGFRVRTTTSGTQALAEVRRRRPALVLLDLLLPEVDGYEVISSIRRDPELADLPIIAVSAAIGTPELEPVAYDVALAKPFDPDRLLAEARDLLATVNRRSEA